MPMLAVLSVSVIGLRAEAAEAAEATEESVECAYFFWDGIPSEALFYRQAGEFRPVEFRKSSRSKTVALKVVAGFELYRDSKEQVDGEPVYERVGQAVLPEGAKKILIVVIPSSTGLAGTYRLEALDDSSSAQSAGSFRFANFTEQSLKVKFAGEACEVLSAMSVKIRPNLEGKSGLAPLLITNAEDSSIINTRLFSQASKSSLVLIADYSPSGTGFSVKILSQRVARTSRSATPAK